MKRLSVALVFIVLSVCHAQARPDMLEDFRKHYAIKDDTRLGVSRCAICHTRAPQRNVYGRSVRAAMKQIKPGQRMPDVFKAVEKIDSDEDGVTNGDEIRADTIPADPRSKPTKAGGNLSMISWYLPLFGVIGVVLRKVNRA